MDFFEFRPDNGNAVTSYGVILTVCQKQQSK
jgi:hypothetical protein